VFLRPVVLRDADQADLLSVDRYELMRGSQIEAQPKPSIVTPINSGPLVPPGTGTPLPPPPAPGAAASAPAGTASAPLRAVPAPLGR
jgi:general secretion pathway protein D